MDLRNMGVNKVVLVTDSTVAKLDAVRVASESLEREGVQFEVFDRVRVEPKDSS